jgi:ferric-dicitrate binding protein FerR (iron transport regulator)
MLTLLTVIMLAQAPRAVLVTEYLSNNGRTRTCEYSDGSRIDIDSRTRCPAVLY